MNVAGPAPLVPSGLPTDVGGKQDPEKAAAAVEGVFMSMLVSEMSKTLPGGGFFGEVPGSEIFEGMFERLMGEEMAKQGGFGIAAFVKQTLNQRADASQDATRKADLERTGATPARRS